MTSALSIWERMSGPATSSRSASRPPRITNSGLRQLTRLASPSPVQRATTRTARQGGPIPLAGGLQDLLDGGPAAAPTPGQGHQGGLPDLGLPATPRTATTSRTVGIDPHVADLPPVAMGTFEQVAIGDYSPADPHLPVHVEQVGDSHGGASGVLGERTEAGIVAAGDGEIKAQAAPKP